MPTVSASNRSARQRASRNVVMQERSAANAGCSGSIPRRTPRSLAYGVSAAIPSATMRRAAAMSLSGAERRRCVDRPPVVLDSCRALGACGGWKHPAAAHAGDPEARVAHQTRSPIYARLREFVTPQRDVRHAVPGAGVDGVRDARPLDGDLVEAEQI